MTEVDDQPEADHVLPLKVKHRYNTILGAASSDAIDNIEEEDIPEDIREEHIDFVNHDNPLDKNMIFDVC